MINVVVVGQTPPPYGGQAVMIEQLLKCSFDGIEMHHIRMAFSDDMDDIGRFKLQKIWHLVSVVFRIVFVQIRSGGSVLYYPPAGPNRVPFYRDAVILILTRWMFKQTVFHFHASGISILYPKLNPLERLMFRLAYSKPSVAIRTSALNPNDGEAMNAKKNVVIEYGVPDESGRFLEQIIEREKHLVPRILFVGALYESKGIRVLVEACRILKQQGIVFELECVGRFESSAYESEIVGLVNSAGFGRQISFPGVLTGDDKWQAYARADIFCFPSFFESESFGLVNIEAMQFALPVVSTIWRGIPGIVEHGVSGFLVDIQSPKQIADKLAVLIKDCSLRKQMGMAGRIIFLERFSAHVWNGKMESVFKELI